MRPWALVLVLLALAGAASPPPYRYFLIGSAADVHPATRPGILLEGGGDDVAQAFRWLLARAGGGDVVILRATGGDGYHGWLRGLGPVDSVETLRLEARTAASDAFVLQRVRRAEAVFLAGGDQWHYVERIAGTPLEAALAEAVGRGVPVGGTSAGLAVLGSHVFTARHGTVDSARALRDPAALPVETGFLRLPLLEGLITDSHFSERDRLGRMMAFLARVAGPGRPARGLGVDEATAVLVEEEGRARVVGRGAAWFCRYAGPPPALSPGVPLDLGPVETVRCPAGGTFDLASWTGDGERQAFRVDAGVCRTLP